MTTIKKVINYFMMFTQFLQKINLKRSLFACLLWSLLAYSLQAALTLEQILEKSRDGVTYYYGEKKKFHSENLFGSKEKEGNDDEEELDTDYILMLKEVFKKVLLAINKCALKDIQANTHGLRVFLAQIFALKDHEMEKPFYNLIENLNMKKGEDNKTGLDVIFYERTNKSQSFLYHVLKNGWEKRWEVEEDIEKNNNQTSSTDWDAWHKEKANKLVLDLKEISIGMQKRGVSFPRIEIDAFLQTTKMDYTLFDYFLEEGKKQHKNKKLYWLNEKYLMEGSSSVTFLYKFFRIYYDKKIKIKMKEEKKEAIFHLINQDNQGINILQPNDKNIDSKMSPTAFVEACYHNEKDAIFLLEKIKETYKNNKDKEKEAIDYLNRRGNGLHNQDALMAALHVRKDNKVFKNRLIEALLEIKGIVVTQKHINFLTKYHKTKYKNGKYDHLKSIIDKKYKEISSQKQQQQNEIKNKDKEINQQEKLVIEKENQINNKDKEISSQNQINKLKNEIKNLKNEINKLNKDHENQINNLSNEHENKIKSIHNKHKTELENEKSNYAKLLKTIEGDGNVSSELKKQIEEKNNQISELKDKLNTASQEKDSFKNKHKKTSVEKKELENQLKQASKKAEDSQGELMQFKDSHSKYIKITEEEKERTMKSIENFRNQLGEKNKEISQLTQKVEEFEKKNLNKTDSKQIELGNQLEDSKRSKQLLEEKLKDNQEKSKDLQKKLDKSNQKVTQITEEINQLKENKLFFHFALKVYSGIISLVLIAAGILGVWYRNMMKKPPNKRRKTKNRRSLF